MELKTITTPAELKADGEEGSITAVFSTFDKVDHGGDVVRKSAFTDGQACPMVWCHDWNRPVGRGVIKVEKDRAIFEGKFFLDTADGLNAYHTVKGMQELQEYSWGFRIPPGGYEYGEKDGQQVRYINAAKLYEVSPVLAGEGLGTHTVSVKEEKATWSTAVQNSLPDSSFAYIEPGGSKDADGRTTPRSLRHFPYKDADGKLDEAHVRNALARIPQSNLPDAAKNAALRKIRAAARKLGIDTADSGKSLKGIYLDNLEGSYEELMDDLNEAVQEALANMTDEDGPSYGYVSVLQTFPDRVLVCRRESSYGLGYGPDDPDTDYYEIPYTLDDMGDPILGTPVEVQFTTTAVAKGIAVSLPNQATRLLADSRGLIDRIQRLVAMRTERKEGRALSSSRRERLAKHPEVLRELAAELDQLLEETKPPEKGADPPDLLPLYLGWQQTKARLISGLFLRET